MCGFIPGKGWNFSPPFSNFNSLISAMCAAASPFDVCWCGFLRVKDGRPMLRKSTALLSLVVLLMAMGYAKAANSPSPRMAMTTCASLSDRTQRFIAVNHKREIVAPDLLAPRTSAGFFRSVSRSQQTDPAKPVVVQPGAPGKPSRTLPPSTRATLPPRSQADVEFMQGMIMHHWQAVEMTALISSHTENKDLRSLGSRISSSQSDEIRFMQRWLAARGERVPIATPGMSAMDMSHEPMALMPSMLTPKQMEALRKAKGAEFDHLFLTGMIQHHNGALTMVKDLFDTAGAGQDADLFNFATDADNTQRAEIRIMQGILEKKSLEEKR